jgi:exodeoxyribonuclease V beta subunit
VRFLNVVARYQDIEALIFEYERLDIEAAASDLRGVRVLTIHKSKGLEYEHVIVMDRLKKTPASRESIIYEYDNITLKNIYLRTKARETLDIQYANALKKEKELVFEDTLNALYVAFTRAKNNLFVILKSKDSAFSLLDLSEGKSGEIMCVKNKNIKVKNSEKLKYKNLYYGTQNDILKLEENQEEDLKSINFGLAMHYMLEMLGSFNKESVNAAKNMMINKYGHLLEFSEIQDIVSRVNMVLESSYFIALVDGECYKEKVIRYKKNLRYIDLLTRVNGRWNVIDYKSSLNYSQHHVKQVKYYVKAIQEITGENVDGYICYLLQDSVKIIKL